MIRHVRASKLFFVIVIFLFVFSEYTTRIDALDGIFNVLEALKVKYIALMFATIYNMLKCPLIIQGEKAKDFKLLLVPSAVFFVCTIAIQISNCVFNINAYIEILYMVVPLVYSYSVILISGERIDEYINCIFGVIFLWTILRYARDFTISNILSINYLKSYSPFENNLAFVTVFLLAFYINRNQKRMAIILLILNVLFMKRFCLVAAVILFVFRAFFRNCKEINSKYVWIFTGLVLMVPMVFEAILSPWMDSFLKSKEINLYLLTMGRNQRWDIVLNGEYTMFGLGSCKEALSNYYHHQGSNYKSLYYDLHNDVLRIYIETTIVGLGCFVWCYLKYASENLMTMFLMLYIIGDMCFNHFLGGGNVIMWISIYLVMHYISQEGTQEE